ncbi:MAG: hypothetical protein J5966_08445, partial [Lachnospiraceae bacterium]|nr:hypothetical protein [Lachnospiraceae bacterium]
MKKWNDLTERAVEWEFTEGDPSVWRYKDNTPVDTLPLGDGEKFAAIREDMSLRLYENNDTNGRLIPYIMTEGGSSVSACTGNNEYESTYHHYMKKVGVDDSLSDASKEDTFFRGHVEEEP